MEGIKDDGKHNLSSTFLANTLTMTDDKGDLVGTLYLENPMRFEGNVEESAKIFFDEVVRLGGIKQWIQ